MPNMSKNEQHRPLVSSLLKDLLRCLMININAGTALVTRIKDS